RAADAAVALLTRPTDQIALFSATGPKGTMSSFLHYVHGEAQKDGLTEYPASIFHELKGEPLFIGTDDPQYRFVQIGAVWIELQKLPIAETIVINSTLTHILQFCAELEDYYVDNDFQIHKAGENFTKVIELELGPEGQKIPFVIGFSIPIRSIKRARKPEKRRRKNA
ncbi:MAG: hypothetical protein K2Z81_12465, partial [Cyanobacteria bacterium]|nr:hypothetical protein [Cyanobacteriota bacterium]